MPGRYAGRPAAVVTRKWTCPVESPQAAVAPRCRRARRPRGARGPDRSTTARSGWKDLRPGRRCCARLCSREHPAAARKHRTNARPARQHGTRGAGPLPLIREAAGGPAGGRPTRVRCVAIWYRTAAAASAAFSEPAGPGHGDPDHLVAQFKLAICFGYGPVPNSPASTHGQETASGTALTAPSVWGCPPWGREGPDRLTMGPSGSDAGSSPEAQSVQVSDG